MASDATLFDQLKAWIEDALHRPKIILNEGNKFEATNHLRHVKIRNGSVIWIVMHDYRAGVLDHYPIFRGHINSVSDLELIWKLASNNHVDM